MSKHPALKHGDHRKRSNKKAREAANRDARKNSGRERARFEDYWHEPRVLLAPERAEFTASWVIGYKRASIAVNANLTEVAIVSLGDEPSFPDDTATCLFGVRDKNHMSPEPGCSCGYYAYNTQRAALSHAGAYAAPLLRVGLAGTVFEFENGVYRAGRQKVSDVWFHSKCAYCSGDASHLLVQRAQAWSQRRKPKRHSQFGRILPVCAKHQYGQGHDQAISLLHLATLLDADVRFLEK